MLLQHRAWEWFDLAEGGGVEAASPFKAEAEAP